MAKGGAFSSLLVVALLAPWAASAAPGGGIYPDGHFETYSTKLTVGNYKNVIQSTIDAGKTLMAPGWNAATVAFHGNEDVAFADVNLSEEQIRTGADGTAFNPGSGGWPTIRYFNKDTGVGGAAYKKKTGDAMCDELKKPEYMEAYVEEAAGTSLCDAFTAKGCSAKQADYATKWKDKLSEVPAQKARLTKMIDTDPKLKDDAKAWIAQRLAILKQLDKKQPAEL